MKQFGLIGKNIHYSFSKKYFHEKFIHENIKASYQNFDCKDLKEVELVLSKKSINGFNVTIPFKQTIMPFLDFLSDDAKQIGAINCIEINKVGKKIGHNTDWIGFLKSIQPHLNQEHKSALILGTGGASKAIAFALKSIGIQYITASRNPNKGQVSYSDLDENIIQNNLIIVNTTPLGTHPNINESVEIPFSFISNKHIVFDLVYNPEETLFLKKAKNQGALTINGYEMLCNQAELGWEIWNKK